MSTDAVPHELGDAAWPGPAPESVGQTLKRVAKSPPGTVFHGLLVLPTLAYLWSVSVPGIVFELWWLSSGLLALAALIWAVRVIAFAVARRRTEATSRSLRWFFLAPVAGAVVLATVWTNIPLRARWSLAQPAFERQLPAALADGKYSHGTSQKIGSYEITLVTRFRDAVIFYESNGDFLNDAGFAYLPRGPRPEYDEGRFESPQWSHLSGHWYAWTASW